MVRWVLVAMLALAPAGAALAGDTDIGCGPGTQIWDGSQGIPPKVLGATTNGFIGFQTFGISFGTLGCNQGGTVTADAQLRRFAAGNLDALARDMAHGQGETLATFAHLYGIEGADREAFYSLTQQQFGAIYAGDDVTETDVIAAIDQLVAADARLAVYARS